MVWARAGSRRLALLLAVLVAVVAWIGADGMRDKEVVSVAEARRDAAAVVLSRVPAAAGTAALTMPWVIPRIRGSAAITGDPFAVPPWVKVYKAPLQIRSSVASATSPITVQPPAAPSPPVFPYVYLGKQLADGRWLVFFGQEGRTRIVGVGDAIDGNWRVDNIDPPVLVVVHIATNEQRVIPIGEGR